MDSPFLALKRACTRLTKFASAEAQARTGLYGAQAQALLVMSEYDGCKISELARLLDLEKPAATTLVRRMEKANLLCRKTHALDARASRLELTQQGHEALAGVKQMIATLDQRLMGGFDSKETAVIMRFLVQASRIDRL